MAGYTNNQWGFGTSITPQSQAWLNDPANKISYGGNLSAYDQYAQSVQQQLADMNPQAAGSIAKDFGINYSPSGYTPGGVLNASGTYSDPAQLAAFNQQMQSQPMPQYGAAPQANPPFSMDPSSAFMPQQSQQVTTQQGSPSSYPKLGGAATSSMPWMPQVRAEVPGAPGGGGLLGGAPSSDTPFLTNSTMQGLQTAMGPFDSTWYDNLSKNMYSQANQNLFENVIPQINQAGQAAGQYGGGSRNQIAQGVAMRGMNDSVMRAMAPQYAQGYESSMNRNLQGAGTAMQGLLGLGGLDISRMNAETNAASAMANAAGAPQYSNPWLQALAGAGMFGQLSGLWGK